MAESPFSPIPMPKSGLESFMSGLTTGDTLLNSMMNRKLTEAQAIRQKKLADLPFAGANVPGPAGQIAGLEMVRQVFGDNSPQYKQAQQAFALSQSSIGSRIGYQDALTKSMPIRYTTPQGRQIIEESNVNAGYSPAGTPQGQPISPGQAPYHDPGETPVVNNENVTSAQENDVLNHIPGHEQQTPAQQNESIVQEGEKHGVPASAHYGMRQLKQDVPNFVLQKNLYATNIDKTLDNIDVKTLAQYNGPLGHLELAKEKANDALGKPSKKYLKYKEADSKFNFLINQTRQFYGDSIQPTAMETLKNKLDPRGAFKSTQSGEASYNAAKDLLNKETDTYRQATMGPSIYRGRQSLKNNKNVEGKIEAVKNINGQKLIKINGEWYHS